VSLLDFVEKLIHRFNGTKETSACDLNSGASVEQLRSSVGKYWQIGLAFDDSAIGMASAAPFLAQYSATLTSPGRMPRSPGLCGDYGHQTFVGHG
jgi:hypothetical protein